MSEESIKNVTKSDSNFEPTLIDHHLIPDMNFNRYCLIKNNISIPEKVINLSISYTLGLQLKILNPDVTLGNYSFGSIKLTKYVDPDKYMYTGYGIIFDPFSEFLFTDGSYGKNIIIFGADMSSSVHVDNKGKDMLILSEGRTQGLDDTKLTSEGQYLINFKQSGKRSVYTIMEATVSYLFMLQKYISSKQKTQK